MLERATYRPLLHFFNLLEGRKNEAEGNVMTKRCLTHEYPHDARRRLAELLVSTEAIVRSVQSGQTARLNCTENDPPFIPGTEAWRFVVRTLREELLPLGWRKSDPSNYSLVINDSARINIVVASSNEATCNAAVYPKTKSLKGLFTEAAVLRNELETDMFPETVEVRLKQVAQLLEYDTWMLLVHIEDEECRAELSLPSQFDDQNVIDWRERIFIPDLTSNGGVPDTPEVVEDDIDIPVSRKVA